MSSVYVVCWIFLQTFQTYFCIGLTMWTLIRLLLEEQSDLGPHWSQKWLLKSQADEKADDNCCDWQFKASISLENRHFIIQERFKKLIYGIWYYYNHKMWHLTACKISVSLSYLKWNDFYRISELMLPTLIQRYDKNPFHFLSNSKTRD